MDGILAIKCAWNCYSNTNVYTSLTDIIHKRTLEHTHTHIHTRLRSVRTNSFFNGQLFQSAGNSNFGFIWSWISIDFVYFFFLVQMKSLQALRIDWKQFGKLSVGCHDRIYYACYFIFVCFMSWKSLNYSCAHDALICRWMIWWWHTQHGTWLWFIDIEANKSDDDGNDYE